MRKLWLFIAALCLCPPAFAQVPQPALSSPIQAATLPKVCGIAGGQPVFCPSNVTDDGTQLLYNGQPLGGGGGSQKVVYASSIAGVTGGQAVIPGSSATGDTDSAAAINAAIAGGNVDLEVDSGFALSAHLSLSSNTTIHCIAPQFGFIMLPSANDSVIKNAHPTAPTTASGTGGFLVSNQGDSNITIRGCTLNDNATQSVTGSNPSGTAHTTNPTTGLIVVGTQLISVNGVTFDHNNTYDSGAWSMVYSNDSNVVITNNLVQQPIISGALVAQKNTDGIDLVGPDQFVFENGNNITAGDDSIVIAAQGDNFNDCTSGSGGFFAATQLPGMAFGPITDVHVDNSYLTANTYFGLRIQSNTELVDRVSLTNTSGFTGADTAQIQHYTSCPSTGNIGKVIIDGWNLQPSGLFNPFAFDWNFLLDASFADLQIKGVTIANPEVNWPVITLEGGTSGTLSLRDWDLNTQSSFFSNVIAITGGTVGQIAASGMNWFDASGDTASFFSGSVVPSILTVSNYAGPNRLLASGFSPTIKNGDAFTNTFPAAATTFINTTFNEDASGTALAGTTPAICANGCTGTWTAAANSPTTNSWEYGSGGLLGGNAACTSGTFCPTTMTLDGVQNYTIRWTQNVAGGVIPDVNMVFRWTNSSNFIEAGCNGTGQGVIFDIVAGAATEAGSPGGSCANGDYSITAAGDNITLVTPGGTVTGTVSGSNTGTAIGPDFFGPATGTFGITVGSFSVMSQ
jgi:hypothetical protein